jgi:diguanylate cyclase (GGDEF)-like protein/PAS domain S-box-containing protein
MIRQAIPFNIFLLAASALPAGLALYAYRHRGVQGTLLLVLLLLAMSEWALAYTLELAVADPAGKVFLTKAKLVGALALPPLWLALTLYPTGRTGWLNRRYLALLAILSVFMLALVWTDVAWRYVRLESSGPLGTLEVGFGFWFWVIVAWSHGLLLLGAALLVSNFFGSQPLYRKQSAMLLLAALAPSVANGLNLMELTPIAHLDLTPFAFPLAAGALLWAISRYGLLDLVPVHRDHVVQGMNDGVIVLDSRNRVVDLNPAAEWILGSASSEAVGRDISRLVANRTGWLIEGYSEASLLGRYRREGKAYMEVGTGEGPARRHYGLVLSSLGEAKHRRANHLLLLRDITERKLDEDHLDRLAHYDLLTGLPNRRLFYDRLNQAIARARRRKAKVALLFVDLDSFKHINDTFGHDIGDLLLKEVADRLTGCLRDVDTVCRLAGDEFVVLLTDIAEAGDATAVAQRIIETLSGPYTLKDHELSVTTSMGISVYPTDGQNGAVLLEKADIAMYSAKNLGKNRFEFYMEQRSVDAHERLGLEGELKLALKRREFRVYYQPIVSMESGEAFGIEALVRWEHPERGLLSPAEFLPLAEEVGLIVPIGLSVLEESCTQALRWHEWRGPGAPLAVCVNLSSTQLKHPTLVQDVTRILRETGLEADNLVLEISESTIMEDLSSASAILERLKSLRVRIVVDDFGTGYSRLPDLNRLPVDFLKLERSLVGGLEKDREKMTLAAATVALAHALGLGVIAEGVETSQQLAHLRGLGCDLAQGHYLGEALPPSRAERALSFIDRYFP